MKTYASALLAFLLTPTLTLAQGGPLEPPGPPGPTMRSLEEVEPRIPISEVPFTITEPGSYYLTRNLTIETGEPAITITTSNVTLDLMGFTLAGNASASQQGVNSQVVQKTSPCEMEPLPTWVQRGFWGGWAPFPFMP